MKDQWTLSATVCYAAGTGQLMRSCQVIIDQPWYNRMALEIGSPNE